jgi:hypothetical protein
MVMLPLAAPPARHEFNFSDSPEMGVTPADLVAAINQYLIPGNANASVDPTSNNDSTQGYQIGSMWLNSITGRVFIARNVSVAAAIWVALSPATHPGYIAGNWYNAGMSGGGMGTGTGAQNGKVTAYPAFIYERCTLSSLGVRISTTNAGNVQAAIYANNPATSRPTGLALASTASMSTASGTNVSSAVSVQLEAGLYWFGTNLDNATATMISWNGAGAGAQFYCGSATQTNALNNQVGLGGVTSTMTFGTWSDLTAASFSEIVGNNLPIVQYKIASVP